MKHRCRLFVEVTFCSDSRETPVCAGYRPHFALPGSQWLLGVVFDELEAPFWFDKPMWAVVSLPYEIDYSVLQPGVVIEIREGARVVGFGKIVDYTE